MAIVQGKLIKKKKGFQVELPTKKGPTPFPVPEKALCFRPADAEDGMTVDVERDAKNRIVKVTIPGQAEVTPTVTQPGGRGPKGKGGPRQRGRGGYDRGATRGGPSQPPALKDLSKAPASVLGLPFHNPYTFLPFAGQPPQRRPLTPLTADELPDQRDRLTGILELAITTRSPLLTCHPDALDEKADHKTYPVLRIGPDVIVPATGIRGAMRNLLTILTGGSLTHLDPHAHLCQGRDANLGPAGPNSKPDTPAHAILAEVIEPGTAYHPGKIRLGTTRLVRADELKSCYRGDLDKARKVKAKPLWVGLDRERPIRVDAKRSAATPWKLKLSGRPINRKGKREGLFQPGDRVIEVPPEIWADYAGRNTHGDRTELRKNDLVWVEPADPQLREIDIVRPDQIRSLQWARWGKRGQPIKDHIPAHAQPDYMQQDGLVDEVTDLFGQVSPDRDKQATAFAARVRPENLVFPDAAEHVERVTLAPLQPPHPGCLAFYRDNTDPDGVSIQDDLRGYKVYRTTQERGQDAPWKYETQGVYEQGQLKQTPQKVNKTCDLLPEGETGRLRIAFRSLTVRELALILQACHVPWRLGGGKPLGLGLCEVQVKALLDEMGEPLQVPGWTQQRDDQGALSVQGWRTHVDDIQDRVRMWTASQQPVERLRYPRAVDANNFGKQRGGHAWFQRSASPRKTTKRGSDEREAGLEPTHIGGSLLESVKQQGCVLDSQFPMIAGQILPLFDPADPLADVLYGYDVVAVETRDEQKPRRRVYYRLEPFDPERHVTGDERSEGNQGKNAEFRKDQKRRRRDDGNDE